MMTPDPLAVLDAAAALVAGAHDCAACGAPVPDGAGALAFPLDGPGADAPLTVGRVVCPACGITGRGLGRLFPHASDVAAAWPAAPAAGESSRRRP